MVFFFFFLFFLKLALLSGSLHKTYEKWREELLGCMAHVEAVIDFASEDEHISDEVERKVIPRVASLRCLL